jgi:hypothetical protein
MLPAHTFLYGRNHDEHELELPEDCRDPILIVQALGKQIEEGQRFRFEHEPISSTRVGNLLIVLARTRSVDDPDGNEWEEWTVVVPYKTD